VWELKLMIKQIRLKNFESHKDTTIDLHNQTNAIIGESDSGKSAIIRAVYWVVFNRPSGDSFCSIWDNDTSVSIVLENDHTIERRKTSKENLYIVNNKKLEGFGQNVPEEISNVLNMGSLNFQTQFDPHFLLPPVSPGKVAEKLNKVINLEVIGKTQYNINSSLKEIKKELSFKESNITDLKKEKRELLWVKKAGIDLEEIETKQNELDSLNNLKNKIANNLHEYEIVNEEIKKLKYIDKAEQDIANLLELKNEVEKHIKEKNKIQDIIDELNEIQEEVLTVSNNLTELEKKYKNEFPEECPLCGSIIKKK
jgi:exonuclease SbcC